MAKTVRFHQIGGPEVLVLDDVDIPEPGPGEVRIRARALGVNRAEAMFRSGAYVHDPVLPAGIGYEVAGEVDAVGAGVDLANGTPVSVVPAFGMNDYPVHGELVIAPAHAVVQHPENLTWTDAAAVWMPFVTAYGGLIARAGLTRGDTVLITAASSSVGLAAIQIANMIGARPVALTRSSRKQQALLDAGAAEVIATSEQDTAAEVRRLTGGAGARVAFDPVGGPGLADLTASLAPEGILIVYGALSEETTPLPVMDVLGKHLTLRGYELFEITTDPEQLSEAVAFVRDGLQRAALKPMLAKVFPLDQVVEAHQYMESNEQFGKIVITV
ncbi:zinc-dependent alcohol dehydrogenase family protein [Pseudonocardia sp. C8]|uniref:zinc-dependent alcohol dehydrogenase family protein n=1 Tax=Pseudonocardia sp. C8 TaxID=2762759 RepID=UPI001642EFFF|nr:zinc-dependent alcohol dehydrogenase family protein [Pseudonocardia sp. C8]MBC3190334.1 zinc-dependent alcohol dehydrogenase family protein [Pseudonocardia sp. C8]